MITPGYPLAKEISKNYTMVPICKELSADIITPISLLGKLSEISSSYFLLESIEGGEKWARYSFLGFDPKLRITCKDGVVTIYRYENSELGTGNKTAVVEEVIQTNDPYEVLRKVMKDYTIPRIEGLPPFVGGLVGYYSYGMFRYAEPTLQIRIGTMEDFDVHLYTKIIAYDHLKQTFTIIIHADGTEIDVSYPKAMKELENVLKIIDAPNPRSIFEAKKESIEFQSNTSKEEYEQMVKKAKSYILEGDIFQVVLSRKFMASYNQSLFHGYRVLRRTNPSPYMVFLKNESAEIMITSPETMVRLQDGVLSTFPIAGSRPRGKDDSTDQRLGEELLKDEKELAEHNMLVDLARNDLGKVAAIGSVHVSEYKKLIRYSKIMHITSEVEGRLKEDEDCFTTMKAILPAGTLSGAPKYRACEIIDELEKEARDIYGGAIGYIDFSGNMDTCIAIRMAVRQGNRVCVQAGAGIVADSIPEKEYEETFHKASAVINALELAGEV